MFHALEISYELFVCELFRGGFIIVSLILFLNVLKNAILFVFSKLLSLLLLFIEKVWITYLSA